jgi:ParB/RepB/Spo0J family partition protein
MAGMSDTLTAGRTYVAAVDPRLCDPWNYREETADALDRLRATVAAVGWRPDPVELRPTGDGRYRILSGHHRWTLALESPDNRPMPAYLIDDAGDDATDLAAAMRGNLARNDATPAEDAAGFARLVAAGWDAATIAAHVGRRVSFVSDRLDLLQLPEEIRGTMASRGFVWCRPLYGAPRELVLSLVATLMAEDLPLSQWSTVCAGARAEWAEREAAASGGMFGADADFSLETETWAIDLGAYVTDAARAEAAEVLAASAPVRERALGLAEIADRLGAQSNTVKAWRARGTLPAPDFELSGVPAWWSSTIDRWAIETGRG